MEKVTRIDESDRETILIGIVRKQPFVMQMGRVNFFNDIANRLLRLRIFPDPG